MVPWLLPHLFIQKLVVEETEMHVELTGKAKKWPGRAGTGHAARLKGSREWKGFCTTCTALGRGGDPWEADLARWLGWPKLGVTSLLLAAAA